jgi:phosphoglycolate phosphatase-like HAD superfamily hydrolase
MKLFVWDFHGVLEKGNDGVVLEITNIALKRHGYSRRMTEKENDLLSGSRWHEYFAYLMPDLDEEECFKLQSTCLEIGQNQPEMISRHVRLNDHADVVLNNIQNANHCQILISNTQPKALDMFVNLVDIDKYFPPSHRFGVNTHSQNQQTKRDYLNQFLQGKDPFDAIISIGDSPGDMEMIHQSTNGIGYLYSHPGKEHRQTTCHYKISDLRLVLQELSSDMVLQSAIR